MPRGPGRKVIALRLSADERAEIEAAFKRDMRGNRRPMLRRWMRNVLLRYARQGALPFAADRNTSIDAGGAARNTQVPGARP